MKNAVSILKKTAKVAFVMGYLAVAVLFVSVVGFSDEIDAAIDNYLYVDERSAYNEEDFVSNVKERYSDSDSREIKKAMRKITDKYAQSYVHKVEKPKNDSKAEPNKGRSIDKEVVRNASFDLNATTEDVMVLMDAFAYVPEEILKKMNDDGWTFRVENRLGDSETEGYTTVGETDYKKKTVGLTAGEFDMITVLHEVGHVVAKEYGVEKELVENGVDEFYDEELYDTFFHDAADGDVYIYWNYDEELAAAFAEYCLYPGGLKEQSPVVYGIFEDFGLEK